jgi:hypothetical protein
LSKSLDNALGQDYSLAIRVGARPVTGNAVVAELQAGGLIYEKFNRESLVLLKAKGEILRSGVCRIRYECCNRCS